MRSRSLARVVIASLGVSVVITLGCGKSPGGPSPVPTFSVRSISPTEGPGVGATVATIAGTGFESGATVTVDGSRVDATVLSATTISVTMPALAAGRVNVTVISPLSQAQASVPGGYRYFGPPIIELLPNIGSTAGGFDIGIRGTGIGHAATVTVDGIVSTFGHEGWTIDDDITLSVPAHAAGPVEVIVTDRWGQTGTGVFTYASPATFDFNGDWQGLVEHTSSQFAGLLTLTIRNNTVASVSCSVCRNDGDCSFGSAPPLALDPPPVVANGEFSFAGSGAVSITGKILFPNSASGSIDMASCVGRGQWTARKR